MGRMGKLAAGTALAVALAASGAVQAADTYSFDKGHTEIVFKWNHVGISTQSGEFSDYDGTAVFDRENLENSKVDVVIRVASIDTGVPKLDDHLKTADFFDAATYPEITFKSSSVKQTGVNRGAVTGDLTILGVTKPVTLDVELRFEGEHPLSPFNETYKGAYYTGFSARTTVKRSDFGMALYAPLVSDWIDIAIDTEMRRQ